MLHEDYAQTIELTHSAVVNGMGGRDSMREKLKAATDEMKRLGFAMTDAQIRAPAQIVVEEGVYYAVVPYELFMAGPGDKKGTMKTFLLAVSHDEGDSWRFIDGRAIPGNRDKIERMVEHIPSRLVLPDPEPARWKE